MRSSSGILSFWKKVKIPFTLNGFPQGTPLKGIVSYAPFYSTTAAQSANASLPKPRFLDPCVNLPCLNLIPHVGASRGPA